MFSNFFLISNFYEILWKNMVQTDRPHMTIYCGACALHAGNSNYGHTHREYAILMAFPRLQWLRERSLTLRLYVHCLSCLRIF